MHVIPTHPHHARGERGFALITALLVMMVAAGLVVASLALAVHDGNQSGLTRNRTAAQHAAEAGLHDELTCLAAPTGAAGGACPGGGATGASAAVCSTPLTKTLDAGLPVESYSVTVTGCGGTLTVASTGSVKAASGGATSTTRTVVAQVKLINSSYISGGTSGGFPLSDAITSFASGASTFTNLVVTGTTAIGNMHIVQGSSDTAAFTNGSLFGSLKVDAGAVSLTNTTPVGGDIVSGGGVTMTGVNVLGNLASGSGNVTLTNSSVNGDARTAAASITKTGSTVGRELDHAVTNLPAAPPQPTFTYTASDWTAITGATTTLACPSTGTLTGLYKAGGSCVLASTTTISGGLPVAIIATGDITMASPPSGAGQLYLISTGGKVTITGNGSSTSIFAYGAGGVFATGNISGQLIGAPVHDDNGTLTFSPPAIAAPNFSFPGGTTLATQVGFVPIVTYECVATGSATTC